MKNRFIKGIKLHIKELAENTLCSDLFLASLQAQDVLSREERQYLTAIRSNEGDIIASKHFYELLLRNSGNEEKVVLCLDETRQSGAVQILKSFKKSIQFEIQPPISSFVGREQELFELSEEMSNLAGNLSLQNITVIFQISSIVGIGGIGKTELCRKFLSLRESEDAHAIWLNADNEGTITTSFKRLARTLGISLFSNDGEDRDINTIVQEVFKELEDDSAFFVYDNCDNPELLRDQRFLPKATPTSNSTPTKIVITSRNSRWPGVKTVLIDKLKPDDAMKLIQMQLGNHKLSNCYSTESCLMLAEILQYFPLALQQAVAHIIQENISEFLPYSVDNYILDFKRKTRLLLNSTSFQNIDCDYSKTTYTTWRVTIDRLTQAKKLDDTDLHLLNLFGYLDPEAVPISLFDGYLEEHVKVKAFDCFESYSLLSFNKETKTLGIHRLLQEVIRLDQQTYESSIISDVLELVNRNEEANSTIHPTAVWRFASKHSSIVKKFYKSSKYTNKQLTPIHLLAQDGNTKAVMTLTEKFNDLYSATLSLIDAKDEFNRTALFIASAFGHTDIVKTLITLGANIQIESNLCFSTFDELKINTLDSTLWTPLHIAAYYNQLATISLLMSKNSELVNKRDSRQQTPPLVAVLVGNIESVEIMKPNDPLYLTCAILTNVARGKSNLRELETNLEEQKQLIFLNQKLVEHDKWSGFDFTAIRIAAHVKATPELVVVLENHGASLFRRSDEHLELLNYCGSSNNGELARYILGRAQNLDLKIVPNKWTILHNAAKYGGVSVIQSIVEQYRVNVNVKDRHWDTPLYQAAYHGQLEAVKYLVKVGADVNIVNKLGCTAIIAAAVNYKLDVVRYLLSLEYCKIFPWDTEQDQKSLLGRLGIGVLHIVVAYDEAELLQQILETRNLQDSVLGFYTREQKLHEANFPLLHAAALFNSTKTIEYLINSSHPIMFEEKLQLIQCILAFYYAAKDGLFELQHERVIDWVVWFAEWIPKSLFSLNPAQFSYLLGIDENLHLASTTSSSTPSIVLRIIFGMIPQAKEMIKLFREYLNVQKDPNLQAGKELTKLVLMFRREA